MFGLQLPSIKHEPYFRAVTVSAPLDIMAAAHLANISESEFLALNPAFKTPVFIPKENRQMLLPVQAANTFEANYRESDPKTLLSWDVFTPTQRISVADLASQTGSSPAEFRRPHRFGEPQHHAGHRQCERVCESRFRPRARYVCGTGAGVGTARGCRAYAASFFGR